MKRVSILAAGALVTMGAGVGVAAAANAGSHSHTLTLVGTRLQQTELGKSHAAETDALRANSRTGKRVGYATESCFFGGTGDRCSVTIALKGGFLVGRYTFPISNGSAPTTAKGKITGGIGAYKGAKGTLKLTTGAGASKHGRWKIVYSD
jgi:hypothetical protein